MQEMFIFPKREQSETSRMARASMLACVLAALMVVAFSTSVYAASAPSNLARVPLAVSQQEGATEEVDTGVVIVAVDKEGPAAAAGIVRGDILLRVGDVEINSTAALYDVVTSAEAGEVVEVVVLHGDEERTFEVTLGDFDGTGYLGVQVVDPQGVTVEDVVVSSVRIGPGAAIVTATAVHSGEVMFFGPGLIVAEVMADSPAAQAGLAIGDLITAVDGQPVAVAEDLVQAIQDHEPGDVVTLTVHKGGPAGAAIEEVEVTLGAAPDDPERGYLGMRFVAMPSGVTLKALPPIVGSYAVPAAPAYPALPAPQPALPGYSYGYPGAACGVPGVTIHQHYYAPAYPAPAYAAPLQAPLVPPALPPVSAAPVYIYQRGLNPEIHSHAEGQGIAGTAERNTIFFRVAPTIQAYPGVPVEGAVQGQVMVQAMPLPGAIPGGIQEAVPLPPPPQVDGEAMEWY